MRTPKTHKINTLAEFATSVYRSDEIVALSVDDGEAREEAVLKIAADSVVETQNRGVLEPALRVMLEAMTQDYAKILTRIDRLAADSNDGSLPTLPNDKIEN